MIPPNSTRFFAKQDYDVFHNPKTRIVFDDARHYLMTTTDRYDIIASDPLDVFVKGTAALYTKEYFDAVKRHLNPGGMFSLYVPLYESDMRTVKSELATFFEAFPNATVWANTIEGRGYDMVFMGQADPLRVNVDELQTRLNRPDYAPVAESLREIGVPSTIHLLSTYAGQKADLAQWLQGAELNRDGDLRLQYLGGWGINSTMEDLIYKQLMSYRRPPGPIFTGSPQTMQIAHGGPECPIAQAAGPPCPAVFSCAFPFLVAAADQDWPINGGPYNIRSSPLTQITPANVANLKVAWSYDSHDSFKDSEMQSNPIIVDGSLYATTPSLRVVALDAATGRELWAFNPDPGSKPTRHYRHRGVTIYKDRLFFTWRNFLYALDRRTGKPIDSFGDNGRIDLRQNLDWPVERASISASSPGVIFEDMIIMGSTVPETLPGTPGHIRAFDVNTGKLRWIFHTIPHPGEPGYETWPPEAYKISGGANAWAGLSIDPGAWDGLRRHRVGIVRLLWRQPDRQ